MKCGYVKLRELIVAVHFPFCLDRQLRPFLLKATGSLSAGYEICVEMQSQDDISIRLADQRDYLAICSLEHLATDFGRVLVDLYRAKDSATGFHILTGSSVAIANGCILLTSDEPQLRHRLLSFLIQNGFDFAAGDHILVQENQVTPLALPIAADRSLTDELFEGPAWKTGEAYVGRERLVVSPHDSWISQSHKLKVKLVVLLTAKTPPQIQLTDQVDPELAFLSSTEIPFINIACDGAADFDHDLKRFFSYILYQDFDKKGLSAFLDNLSEVGSGTKSTIEKKDRKKITIGMATYDDYDGVYFSLQSLRLHHPEILSQAEFIIVDNNPFGVCAPHLRRLASLIENVRYIPHALKTGTSVRDVFFEAAQTDIVLSIDCHVLIEPGAVQYLLEYFDADPGTIDLLQGPILSDDLATIYTHYEPVWHQGNYGKWATDDRALDRHARPFDIPMQGMGLFACRKTAWQGFHASFTGFGADEGYIHEKFRQAGGRTLCLPRLRWLHRFGRPNGVTYPINWEDRIRNYLLGFSELGLDLEPVKEHFISYLGEATATRIIQRVLQEIAGFKKEVSALSTGP
ncbi:glycosyltransferase [Brucella pituitosa]|uniref:glycosyltransferase n=1 Tax=Brucella pituitosa TaxID=571256 RepID=UPI0009A1EDB1|nr:glycosyltransferase [Brucella pituitosa]